jgi:hypothetical protein
LQEQKIMKLDVKRTIQFAVGGLMALLGIVGLKVAAGYGSGSHYQGGVLLFLFLIAMIFYQIRTTRFDRGHEDQH